MFLVHRFLCTDDQLASPFRGLTFFRRLELDDALDEERPELPEIRIGVPDVLE